MQCANMAIVFFFITISPYEWTFPFPPFLEDMRARYFKDVTDIPTIETLHIAHVLEQIAWVPH